MIVLFRARRRRQEFGIALLIAIFVLLLVCVVGIAMMVATGTETSLTGNYYSSTAVYYAGIAGLEEGRGRLLPKNHDYLGNVPGLNYLPSGGGTVALGNVLYILNPLPSETVNPTDLANPSTFPDTDYNNEFPTAPLSSATIYTTSSVSDLGGYQGPRYKWVRINPVTEYALGVDVNGSGGALNQVHPIYFDGIHLTRTITTHQAFEVTSLSVLTNGSQRMMQYVVVPDSLNLSFYSALTIAGNAVNFDPPPYTPPPPPASPPPYPFHVRGQDQYSTGHPAPCSSPVQTSVPAIGVINTADDNSVTTAVNATKPTHYTGVSSAPSIQNINVVGELPTGMQTPTDLEQLVQTIKQNADAIITGPATQMDMPSGMSASNPMTVFVGGDPAVPSQGNLSLNSGFTGYGILVVTGELDYTDDVSWEGIVLVIGQGVIKETSGGGNGEFDGAVFVANTRDSSGNVLLNLGPASYTLNSSANDGIYYNTCWINQVQKPITYKVVSFREIQQ
ncbi:MAG TPA: pilus assembly PilX N-terminal domain-containing protein [Terriglobales bacterium]|nr:pilus assembly PilX N-terminal domain-containing protein [Terriglobales bacterium]